MRRTAHCADLHDFLNHQQHDAAGGRKRQPELRSRQRRARGDLSHGIRTSSYRGNPIGVTSLNVRKDPNDSGTGFVDSAKFQAFKVTGFEPGAQPFLMSLLDDPPIGTCVAYSNPDDNNDVPFTNGTDLNAGASFTLKGPSGSVTVPPAPIASGGRTTLSSNGTYLVTGNYTITGTGGTDVGSFTSNFNIAAVPSATGPANNSTVTRANGMTVTWTPGTTGTMIVQVVSGANNAFTNGFTIQCSAPMSSGSVTIPPYRSCRTFPGTLVITSFLPP